MKPLETSKGERSMRGRGKGDNPAQVGRTLKVQEEETHILPSHRVMGTGLGTPPEKNQKPLADMEKGRSMTYMDLIRKLEKRFGFRELPETAQVQFNNARQTPDELLEDWAVRVLSLATRAFRDLPEAHMYQQAVVRLCQGASDKEVSGSNITIRLYLGPPLGVILEGK